MTGKEDWEKKYREEIEEVNLRADMVCFRNDELENKLSKYERAFEILKDTYTLIRCKGEKYYLLGDLRNEITKEEAKLIKELIKDAKD